jgi:uracil-DNA glycosylase family 4
MATDPRPANARPSAGDTPEAVEPVFVDLYERIADCPNCALARTRTRTVPGAGPSSAEVMFIGEAPGQREDERGLPFVGPAGRFLEELLRAAGWRRDDVYIANVVKCRPPANRDPLPEEIAACRPYLDEQFEIVDPHVVVTLGRFSMQRWFPDSAISRIHGQPRTLEDGRVVVPMYHPAAALRNGGLRPVLLADFAQLPGLLERAREDRVAGGWRPRE